MPPKAALTDRKYAGCLSSAKTPLSIYGEFSGRASFSNTPTKRPALKAAGDLSCRPGRTRSPGREARASARAGGMRRCSRGGSSLPHPSLESGRGKAKASRRKAAPRKGRERHPGGREGCPRARKRSPRLSEGSSQPRTHPIRGARESFLAIMEAVEPLIAGISAAAGRRQECPEILAAPGRGRGRKHGTHPMSLTPRGSVLSGPLFRSRGRGAIGSRSGAAVIS